MRLSLTQEWVIDEDDSLGDGGFGYVLGASSSAVSRAAAKFVKKEKGVERDLLVSEAAASPYLVPILDSGETDGHYVLIMPRAEHSLRDKISSAGPLQLEEAVGILSDLAHGIEDLGGLVHRDLKPENILWLDGHWAIADFGLARYVDATTAEDTKKGFLSKPYAAPEQWKFEHATWATDVYAFGIIAYELIASARPFPGPSADDFRKQHLSAEPPRLSVNRKMGALIVECLEKAPGARPAIGNIRGRLARVLEEANRPGANSLIDAQFRVVQERAEAGRLLEIANTESERRDALFTIAARQLEEIVAELLEAVTDQAPAAIVSGGSVSLGQGRIEISGIQKAPRGWGGQNPTRPTDVIAAASIEAVQSPNSRGYRGRSHSLYFCNYGQADEYAWYEIAFMEIFSSVLRSVAPFAIPPGPESGLALSNVVSTMRAARPWLRVTPGDADDFNDRWMDYLGKASSSLLSYPSQLPER